ncbi:MAG: HAD family hydrolase [Anaerolineae bacterium]|nr:HAD family hydrolase [Anaerolineae bacterium]
MCPVRAVVFDFGNTLATVDRDWDDIIAEGAAAMAAFLRQNGMENLPENFPARWIDARKFAAQKSAREMEEHKAEDTLAFLLQFVGYPKADRELVARAIEVFFAPEVAAHRPYPDTLATLRALREEGYRLGALSNATHDPLVQGLIDGMGLRPYLDTVVTSAAIEFRKPRPEAFNAVLDRWDVPGYEAVMVGDTVPVDIRGAQDVGMWAILANMTPNPENEPFANLFVPDATVTCLSEVIPIIAEWNT